MRDGCKKHEKDVDENERTIGCHQLSRDVEESAQVLGYHSCDMYSSSVNRSKDNEKVEVWLSAAKAGTFRRHTDSRLDH